MKKTFMFLSALCIGLLSTAAFATNTLLSDTSRTLSSYNGTGASGTLSFDDTMMHSKFCNNVNQWYSYANNTLTPQGVGMSTMMYCEWLPMTLENNFTISTGTSAIISGDILTITTTNNNVFVFTQNKPTACTMEYAPVCGKVQVQCITAPCPAITQTFGNTCMAQAAGAKDIKTGECTSTNTGTIVGNDKDEHGCIWSAGYTWNATKKACTRSREDMDETTASSGIIFPKYNCEQIGSRLQLKDRDTKANKNAVTVLQTKLQQIGYFKVKPTGYFGPITKRALQAYQKSVKVGTTGILGPVTQERLYMSTCIVI
jgi:hypothetical protein